MQTQQIISAATGNFFFGTAGTGSAEKAVDNSFEKLFMAFSEKYDTTSGKEMKDVSTESKVLTGETDEKTVTKNVSENKGTKQVAETVSEKEQSDITDEKELAERMAEVVAQVTQVVKDVLNLTTEQLEETMNLLGITETDLLNADVLKQLVLTVNGEQDATAFLTDGDLLSQMQQLLGEVESILEEAGMSAEEMAGWLKDAGFAELFENAMDELSGTEAEKAVTEDTTVEHTENVIVKETEITFHKEVSDAKTDVTGDGAERNTDSQTELAKEDVTFTNQFMQNLQNAVTEGIKETAFGSDLAAQIREIANQILEQVRVVVTPEMTSLEIQLTPEHLGKVNITVTEQDGVMKASFVTDNELAKEAIESNLIQFKQMMNEQGIRVESVEVTVSEFAFDKNGEASQSSQEEKKQNKAHFIMEEEKSTASMQDELALHFMEGGESTVNYMA